jgi:two-component system, response regulator
MEAHTSGLRLVPAKKTEKPGQRLRHRPHRVLLAEDDPADQDLIRRSFEGREIELQIVADGRALLDYFVGPKSAALQSPDLILLDLNMPGKSGIEALARIRSTVARWIPIVVFSGSRDLRDVIECYEAGCSSYITKPDDFEAFSKTVDLIVRYWLELCDV